MTTLSLFNSIRWRLQIWYGLILVAVVTALGISAFHREQITQFQLIEEELRQRVFVLANSLPRPPRGDQGPHDGPRGEFGQRRPPPDRPPPEDGPPPGDFPGGPRGGPPRLRLKTDEAALFENGMQSPFYYVFWFRDGEEIEHSPSTPDSTKRPERSDKGGSAPVRKRGEYWEAYHFTPRGECLLVGRSVTPDLARLRHTSWYLCAVGAGVLALGLVGGGWIANRAIRPIEDISASAVKIASGDLSHRINISDTDTELGRLAGVLNSTFERLDAAFSQQTRFTSDAAHELRAPISQILSHAHAALARERTAAEFRKTVEACERAALRMRRLIDSLLELARLNAGQESMKRTRFDLARTIRDCVEAARAEAEKRKIKIECHVSSLDCDGDPERLAQVIAHLLANAIDYNKDQGTVRILARRQRKFTVVTVSDTGQGIPSDALPHIFERFYRAEASGGEVGVRTGLSLAISKAIVAAHGGNIEVSSNVGAGTTFTVLLPAEPESPQ